ncbi:MAG: allantoinase AllB [Candidatus Sericytochromatia bacterium]|nr:allantoinase AllB [Candidatus Sericytochromatia bacterium]
MTAASAFAVCADRILTPAGWSHDAVLVSEGRVQGLIPRGEIPAALRVENFEGAELVPGVVDSHVHLNDPGRAEWEGFRTGTRAAAAGGITTVVDMPLNSIPVTTTRVALEAKRAAASQACWVDVAFWGGVIPGNQNELLPMVESGVVGFKAFMCHSGIDAFPASPPDVLRHALNVLAPTSVPLLVHAELDALAVSPEGDSSNHYLDFLRTRPPAMEVEAIRLLIQLLRETGGRAHIVHLSSADALPLIAQAKAEGLRLSVETCPHYLTFSAEDIPLGATEYKCAPPIRERENRERLWQGLSDGVIDFIACDHSPCTPALKLMESGDFLGAWGGISSLQFSVSAVWTEAHRRGFDVPTVWRWLAARTAAFCGLGDRKGCIAPGYDADLVAWRPAGQRTVQADFILHRHSLTPYLGRSLLGEVDATWVRGEYVYNRGELSVDPRGICITPGSATTI